MIVFRIPGKPKGKGRPKFARMGKFVKTYSPKETVNYENWVKLCFQERAGETGFVPFKAGVPLRMIFRFNFQYPKSMSKKKKAITEYVTKTPDADNIIKAVADSLNGIAYHDDAQVARIEATKLYIEEAPYVEVCIVAL